jgi:phosphoenolpyruvate carboxylase
VAAGPELAASLAADAGLLPDVRTKPGEPYRAKCRMIAEKLRRTLHRVRTQAADWGAEATAPPPGVYSTRDELVADLDLIAADLRRAGRTASADGAIRDLTRVVEVFGLHLLTLDIRQHSRRHETATAEVLAAAGVCPNYLELSPDERSRSSHASWNRPAR